jgi:hypothetical protein
MGFIGFFLNKLIKDQGGRGSRDDLQIGGSERRRAGRHGTINPRRCRNALINLSQKESQHSPILGFAGRIEAHQPGDVGTMMDVRNVYFSVLVKRRRLAREFASSFSRSSSCQELLAA